MDPDKSDEEKVLFSHHLHAVGKLKYVKRMRSKKSKIKCILCAVKEENPDVISYKIYEEELLFISLNLYPYNPGHLMVIPTRHVENFEKLTAKERNRIFKVVIQCQKLLNVIFSPAGFNVGYNQGVFSGASIKHVHVHVVPRYEKELGFVDIIGNGRIVIEQIDSVMEKIASKIDKFIKPPKHKKK